MYINNIVENWQDECGHLPCLIKKGCWFPNTWHLIHMCECMLHNFGKRSNVQYIILIILLLCTYLFGQCSFQAEYKLQNYSVSQNNTLTMLKLGIFASLWMSAIWRLSGSKQRKIFFYASIMQLVWRIIQVLHFNICESEYNINGKNLSCKVIRNHKYLKFDRNFKIYILHNQLSVF